MTHQIILLGSHGRLGREVARQLSLLDSIGDVEFDPTLQLHAWSRAQCDVTDFRDLRAALDHRKSTIVINCTAMNGMEQCEENPALAFATNAQACAEIATITRGLGAIFIHFSTDYACMRDAKFPRTERCVGEPCGMYGISKRAGEEMIRAIDGYHMIFRVSSLYGDDFAGSLSPIRDLRRDTSLGTQEKPIRVLKQFAAPSSVGFVAEYALLALESAVESPRTCSGVYNLVPHEPMWKSDFARYAIDAFLPDKHEAVITEGKLAIPRPEFSVLNNEKFETTFGVQLPNVYQVFEKFAMLFDVPDAEEPALPPESSPSPPSSPKPA